MDQMKVLELGKPLLVLLSHCILEYAVLHWVLPQRNTSSGIQTLTLTTFTINSPSSQVTLTILMNVYNI